MKPRALQRTFLWLFVGCLAVTALMAIVAVLGGDFGQFEIRVLASSGSVSAASICAMACAAFRERGKVAALGTLGIVLAGLALLAVLILIWVEPGHEWVKMTLLLVLFSAATAHCELLLLPPLAQRHVWVQRLAMGAIALLTLLIGIVILWEPSGHVMPQMLGVVAIIVSLLTLVVPVLWKIGGGPRPHSGEGRTTLTLTCSPDGLWTDSNGVRYDVRRCDDEKP